MFFSMISNLGDAMGVGMWPAHPFVESQWLILDGLVVACTCVYSKLNVFSPI